MKEIILSLDQPLQVLSPVNRATVVDGDDVTQDLETDLSSWELLGFREDSKQVAIGILISNSYLTISKEILSSPSLKQNSKKDNQQDLEQNQ